MRGRYGSRGCAAAHRAMGRKLRHYCSPSAREPPSSSQFKFMWAKLSGSVDTCPTRRVRKNRSGARAGSRRPDGTGH